MKPLDSVDTNEFITKFITKFITMFLIKFRIKLNLSGTLQNRNKLLTNHPEDRLIS